MLLRKKNAPRPIATSGTGFAPTRVHQRSPYKMLGLLFIFFSRTFTVICSHFVCTLASKCILKGFCFFCQSNAHVVACNTNSLGFKHECPGRMEVSIVRSRRCITPSDTVMWPRQQRRVCAKLLKVRTTEFVECSSRTRRLWQKVGAGEPQR